MAGIHDLFKRGPSRGNSAANPPAGRIVRHGPATLGPVRPARPVGMLAKSPERPRWPIERNCPVATLWSFAPAMTGGTTPERIVKFGRPRRETLNRRGRAGTLPLCASDPGMEAEVTRLARGSICSRCLCVEHAA